MEVPSFKPAKGRLILPAPGEAETGDGDTMRVDLPLRLVSVDTPEKRNFAGPPERAQTLLNAALAVLEDLAAKRKVTKGFAAYFAGRVRDGGAARHDAAAEAATQALRRLRTRRLAGPAGKRRDLAIILAGEGVDDNGRMLAYLAPFLDPAERRRLDPIGPEARTFNFDLVAEGWAACFPVWPSFPSRRPEFEAFLDAAGQAWRDGLGNWEGQRESLLTGYEFRAMVKLGRLAAKAKAGTAKPRPSDYLSVFGRHCVDRLGNAHGRLGFVEVPPGDRLWTWSAGEVPALQAWMTAPTGPAGRPAAPRHARVPPGR